MIGAELICSDDACAESVEASVAFVRQLDALVCDSCGCTLETLALWEVVELRAAPPVSLPLAA